MHVAFACQRAFCPVRQRGSKITHTQTHATPRFNKAPPKHRLAFTVHDATPTPPARGHLLPPQRPDRINCQLTPTRPPSSLARAPSFYSIKPLGFPFIRALLVSLCTSPASVATSLMPSELCVMSWKRDDYGFCFLRFQGRDGLQCLRAQIVLVTRHNHTASHGLTSRYPSNTTTALAIWNWEFSFLFFTSHTSPCFCWGVD
jgi:hypothetical protein